MIHSTIVVADRTPPRLDRPARFSDVAKTPSLTRQTETRKAALLEVAAHLFHEQGFHSAGIKQIIDEAGIDKETFYSHFTSREEVGTA